MQQSSQTLSRNENNEISLSVYSGELSTDTVAQNVAKVKAAFPTLTREFFILFMDRVKENGFTNERLIDAVNNVIDHCQYPTPTLANFLSWDKRVKVMSYNDLCNTVSRREASFDNYTRIVIRGCPFYVRTSDKILYNIPSVIL